MAISKKAEDKVETPKKSSTESKLNKDGFVKGAVLTEAEYNKFKFGKK